MTSQASHLVNGRIIGENVDYSTYSDQAVKRGDPAFIMSRGDLMEFARCPRRWMAGYRSGDTKPQEWGALIDCLLLTPERFNEQFAVAPATYPAEGKKGEPPTEKPWNWNATYCKEWRAQRDGQTIVKHDDKIEAEHAVARLRDDERVMSVLSVSRKQVFAMAEYYDLQTGLTVPLRVLIDLVPDADSAHGKALADLKTCFSAERRAWARQVFEHDYHVQAALYLDVYNAATGEGRTDFLHILQESFPPYEIGRRILSSEFIELGRFHYMNALAQYCQCLKSNWWPGYDDTNDMILDGFNMVEPEAWMITK